MLNMKKIKYGMAWLLMLNAIFTFGQTNNSSIDVRPYIEVLGTSEMEIIPDEIYIGIVIRERYVNKTKITIEEQEEKLKKSLQNIDIRLENLYLSDLNADFVKVHWRKKDVITKKEYTLKLSTASELSAVFQELENIEINEASISRVDHSKIDSLRKQVKIQAIKDAKDKADYLLTAIGERAGKPLVITESPMTITRNEVSRLPVRSTTRIVETGGGVHSLMENKKVEIEFQKIKLYSNLYVKFSIE